MANDEERRTNNYEQEYLKLPVPFAELASLAGRFLPRILTQACRDPGHPAYGCFDRNWWHYKIRDFPSIILQQGGYAVWQAARAGLLPGGLGSAKELAAAAARFWNLRAQKHGAFEEYYPWEQGYPPLAFGTLAAAKLVLDGVVAREEINAGLEIASRQLIARFEGQAANQQIAGLAAMACLHKISADLISASQLEAKTKQAIALQNADGWFEEYGGPDVGYLSVTIDCLWDYLDAVPCEEVKRSLISACRFISKITACGKVAVGLHNARNTDYLVPYGLVRAACTLKAEWPEGAATVRGLFSACDTNRLHPLPATDDRYLCHYIGHSVIRAVNFLRTSPLEGPNAISEARPVSAFIQSSGHWVVAPGETACFGGLLSAKKGGAFCFTKGDPYSMNFVADYGWQIIDGDKVHITHWWSDDWKWKTSEGEIDITGPFVVHKETESSPLKHFVLRAVSLLLGRQIIAELKKRLIFHRPQSPYRFHRIVKMRGEEIFVEDLIDGLLDAQKLLRAPRPSKRHVASADSFQIQDLGLVGEGFVVSEERLSSTDGIKVVTTIRCSKA